jgi:hypothetical protein
MELRMSSHPNHTIKSILLLAGSFSFVFLLGEMVHEFGHYLMHMVYDTQNIQVHLDPFGGSMIVGVTDLPGEVAGVTSAAGPLFNLALGITCTLMLWRKRAPVLLPLVLWGPVSMVQEGVTFSLGLLTPGGDAQWIATLGIPQQVILLAGILLLMAGIGTITTLLPLAGVKRDEPQRTKLLILLVGMCSLMLIRSVHSFLASPGSIMENFIPLLFSILLAAIVVLLHEPVSRIMRKIILSETPPVTWSASALALILGASVFLFQVFAMN